MSVSGAARDKEKEVVKVSSDGEETTATPVQASSQTSGVLEDGGGSSSSAPLDPSKQMNTASLVFVALVANLGSLLFGYDFGATSWLLIGIDTYADSSTDDNYYTYVADNSSMTGLIAAGASIGATLTYLVLLFAGNGIPKKDEIMLAALLFFIGALLESVSGQLSWDNFDGLAVLLTGRFVFGAGIATSFHSVPQYVSECGPAELRGMVGSATEALAVTGVALGFIIGYLYEDEGWVVPFRIGYIIAVVMGFMALFIPQSPSWMVRAGFSKSEVLDAIQFIYPNATEEKVTQLHERFDEEKKERLRWEQTWKAMRLAIKKQRADGDEEAVCCGDCGGRKGHYKAASSSDNSSSSNSSGSSSSSSSASSGIGAKDAKEDVGAQAQSEEGKNAAEDNESLTLFESLPAEVKVLLTDPVLLRCLYLALGLVVLQIGTGQSAILYFAGDIFDLICPDEPDLCIVGLGVVKLVSAYAMTIVADSLGRRDFLLGGTAVLVLGMITLLVGLSYDSVIAALVGLYVAVAGYEVGFGSMLWILLSEIFPQFVRSAANSIAIATLFACSTVLTFTLPYFEDATGLLPIFALFTAVSCAALIILYFFAPDTRGVELEEAYKQVDLNCKSTMLICGCHLDDAKGGSGYEGTSETTDLLAEGRDN